MTDPGFWKKVQVGSEGSKSPRNEVFRVAAKIISPKIYMLVFFSKKVSSVKCQLFTKTTYLGKI